MMKIFQEMNFYNNPVFKALWGHTQNHLNKKLPFQLAKMLQRRIVKYLDDDSNPCFPFGLCVSPCNKHGMIVLSPNDVPESWDVLICNAMFHQTEGKFPKVKLLVTKI